MGRKNLPYQIKEAQGTLRKSRINGNEPRPYEIKELPSPPDYFNSRAVELWEEIGSDLINQRLLSTMDINAFSMLVMDLSLYEDCLRNISEKGSVIEVKTREGTIPKINPYHNLKKSLSDKIVKLFSEFGLTPASRSNVTKIEAPKVSKLELLKQQINKPINQYIKK